MAPRPTEVTLLAKLMLPPGYSKDQLEDAKVLAKEMITKLDESRQDVEQWILSAKTSSKGPSISVGPWTTKNQAVKAASKLAFDDDPNTTPGVGYLIHRLQHPVWLDKW